MRVVLKILGAIGAIILGVVVVAALQYPEFRIERSRNIPAPAEKIFPSVTTMAQWREWSPWTEMDPTMTYVYSGPAEGVGAKQAWSSKTMGQGNMTLTAVEPPNRVKFDLVFEGMNAQNTGEVILTPSGESTLVTWAMEGKNNLLGRIFFTVYGRRMMDKAFDRGLELLEKTVAANTAGALPLPAGTEITLPPGKTAPPEEAAEPNP